ncbi:unnamed protein product [Tetraodon nigroviridis]|uniref:Translocation protein SEC62 n=1 Tax=Tetraodon nigroviridis TaxID=99883 RepID=Q4SK79_TETNG|nr:unnamed protein product [Tetraodon nigroviridis]
MAERKRNKKRIQEVSEPTKEKAVAKYLRFNCPTKSTNMLGHRVDYFIASKAVECLLDSKWAKAKKGEEALFSTRESVVDYCNRWAGGQEVPSKATSPHPLVTARGPVCLSPFPQAPEEAVLPPRSQSDEEEAREGRQEGEGEGEGEGQGRQRQRGGEEREEGEEEGVRSGRGEEREERVRVDLRPRPLEDLRHGSDPGDRGDRGDALPAVAGGNARGGLLPQRGGGLLRGRNSAPGRGALHPLPHHLAGDGRTHHFWLLPNLTADVGFIDSFRPLYTHDYKGPRASGRKGSDKDGGGASAKAQRSDSDKSDSEKKDGEEEEEDEEEEESKEADGAKEAEGEGTDRHSDSDTSAGRTRPRSTATETTLR